MDSKTIRAKYIQFFKDKGHTEIAPAKLVPENDPTTLFTSSGMQPLVPYLLGQEHPGGKRLVDSQPSFRAEDIEEVGDNRHTTCFEMLGNWSLGEYFKESQLPWYLEFLTEIAGLKIEKLYVTVFSGDEQNNVPKDTESVEIWKKLFKEKGIEAKDVEMGSFERASEVGMQGGRIFYYDASKNWWSRSGKPEKMPVGEIGGPDSEVFYEFSEIEHDPKYGKNCHPNCDCGRFVEIGNSVFIQYQKQADGSFKELPQKNVDFGGGLERTVAARADSVGESKSADIFETDLYIPIIKTIENVTGKKYEGDNKPSMRVIADHIKAAVFLIRDNVLPDNKLQGYVLRRLLRRAATKAFLINEQRSDSKFFDSLVKAVTGIYPMYFDEKSSKDIENKISHEIRKFRATLERGLKRLDKSIQDKENLGLAVFNMFQSYGYPLELTIELLKERGIEFTDSDMKQFEEGKKFHIELSRTASAGMFKGGLADQSEITTKYHTTTHLLHQALRDVLGPQVFQKGSNITAERLRFDFSFDRKLTGEEVKKVEQIINDKIKQDLPVDRMVVPVEKAREMNAIGLFDDKYAKEVSIYGVGAGFKIDLGSKDQRDRGGYYSLEFCGGPHVEHTGLIGGIKIVKEEAISAGIRRIRAVIAE